MANEPIVNPPSTSRQAQPQTAHDAPERTPQASPFPKSYRVADEDSEAGRAARMLESGRNPFADPRVQKRLTDQQPEIETQTISTISWSGAEHKPTWALFHTQPSGIRQKYAEIPQADDSAYETDQRVIKEIMALDPAFELVKYPSQVFVLWPSVKCTFQRVPHGKGTRLQLVNFEQMEHDRVHDVEREEQREKLMKQNEIAEANAAVADMKKKKLSQQDDPDGFHEAFPRDDNNQPVDDDELHAERVGHWIDNDNNRRHIMAWLNEKMDERLAPKGEWRKEWAAKQCNVATGKIHDYTGSRDDFQKSTWKAIQRHDKEKMALGKLMLDSGNKPTADTWATIFEGQKAFWDTVASGATLDDIADKVEAYIEAAKNAATTNEKTPTGATTPDAQSKSAEPPKNGQETPKTNPVKTQSNGVKPVEPTTKEDIRDKYTKPISGKDYLQVSGRVLLFRRDHPSWTIETDNVVLTDTSAVFKCTIRDDAGRIISTGHGRATEAATKSLGGRFIEKAETAAIGRALALAGFGTDDTLDDVEYPADSSIAA